VERGFLVAFTLIIMLVLIWVVVLSFGNVASCPEKLPNDYYHCESTEDCFLHPKYDCINEKPLTCIISEDLAARQEIASMLGCDCVSNKCVTVVIR